MDSSEKGMSQLERIQHYANIIQKQTGKAVRSYRADGYVNMLNKYGTSKDTSEHYHFEPEPMIGKRLYVRSTTSPDSTTSLV